MSTPEKRVPALVIRIGLEEDVEIEVDAETDEQNRRLQDWIESSVERRALVARAVTLRDSRRDRRAA